MPEPDTTTDQPTPEQIAQMWQDIQFEVVEVNSAAIAPLLSAFQATYANGGAILRCVQASDHPVFRWFVDKNDVESLGLLNRLDLLDEVESVPLKIQREALHSVEFQRISALIWDGDLAEVLVQGGAYQRFSGRAAEAKQLGQAFCQAVCGDRYEDVLVYKTYDAWNPWFLAVAWDITWVAIDKREHRVWVLCVTDTD